MDQYKEIQRNFILGDSWLYYKIYTGPKTSDVVLIDIIKRAVESLKSKKIVDKWFFIRYADPKHHLRVRFHYSNSNHLGEIINELCFYLKDFVDQDLIWKIQTDTYQREMERYGSKTIELSEELFFYDSKMIVEFIDLIEGEEGSELRWLFALRAIDSFLSCFHYEIEEKLLLFDMLKTGFGNEFGMSRLLKKQLDEKYRKERKKIEEFMTFKKNEKPDYDPILFLIGEKEKKVEKIAKKILNFNNEENLEMDLNDLMGSYVHMFMNRLFTSKNRLHEMVCYDFLYRYYKSTIARKKKNR